MSTNIVTGSQPIDTNSSLWLVEAPVGTPVVCTLPPNPANLATTSVIDGTGNASNITVQSDPSTHIPIGSLGQSVKLPQPFAGYTFQYNQTLGQWVIKGLVFASSTPFGWVRLADGGVIPVQGGQNLSALFASAVNASGTIQLPPLASAVDKQTVQLHVSGSNPYTGVTFLPDSGTALEDPTNPGAVLPPGAPAIVTAIGANITYQFSQSSATWLRVAS